MMARRRADDAKRRAKRLATETPEQKAWREDWTETVNAIHARNGFPSLEEMHQGVVPDRRQA